MDFGHGDGSFGAGERSMANLLNELGGEHRQRNNSNNNNGGGGGGGGGVLSMSPANTNSNSNALKPCRSVSEMDLSKSRDGDDHHSREVQGPMKLPRTDSFPFDLKTHHHHHQFQLQQHQNQNQSQQQLGRTNSMVSDGGRLGGYSPANSSVSDPVSVFYAGDSAARTAHASLLQPFHPFKTAGLPALSMGRETASHMGMGMSMGMHAGAGVVQGSRFCFTQSQWQELEHQALIFKYMLAGVPVPAELLLPIRKSVAELAGLSAGPGSHHPGVNSWGSFHLRFANNTDPEPGRCRRTDGKKWRCSRDVAPDQKYCERHMHRGRPRSRKPVEGGQTAINTSGNNNATAQSLVGGPNSSSAANNNAASSMIGLAAGRNSTSSLTNLRPSISINNTQQQNHNQSNSALMGIKPFSSSGTGGGIMSINGVSGSSGSQFKPPLHVSPASAMPNKDYRYMNWMKGEIDEQILFSEANPGNNNMRVLSQDSPSMNSLAMLSSVNNGWRLMPSKLADTKVNTNPNTNSLLQYNSSQLRTIGQEFGLMPEMNLQQGQQPQQQQQSFLSNGFGVVESVRDQSAGGQPLRHFFDDWPRSRDPWSEMEAEQRSHPTTTQLSISIPMTSSDFAGTNSSSPRGKLSLSSLKLSMSMSARGAEDDPTQMALGVGMGLGLMNEERQRQSTNNWIPVSWQSPMGGPLAEVLQSTTNAANAAVTSRGCKTPGGLNLMTEAWDLSPHGSPRMASPTGVLQKTLASLSDSSSGSSPRAVAAAAAAAKHDQTTLQHNLGGL